MLLGIPPLCNRVAFVSEFFSFGCFYAVFTFSRLLAPASKFVIVFPTRVLFHISLCCMDYDFIMLKSSFLMVFLYVAACQSLFTPLALSL